MLFLLSPAKTLDYESPLPAAVAKRATPPRFVDQASALIDVLRFKAAEKRIVVDPLRGSREGKLH